MKDLESLTVLSSTVMPSSHCTILARFFTRRQVLINRRQVMLEIGGKSVTIAQCELSKTRSEGIADASPTPVKYLAC